MCYTKPGPRCAAHARPVLVAARAAFQENRNDETFAALKRAEDDYYATSKGLKELRKRYESTKDGHVAEYLNERRKHRAAALAAIGVQTKESNFPTHAELSAQALNSPLEYSGRKPRWWKSYAAEAASANIPTKPELLDVINTAEGEMAVIWEDDSQASNDVFPVTEKGWKVQRLLLRSMKTGEEMGYIKASHVNEETLSRVFGSDEFASFRARFAYGGSTQHYPFHDANEVDGRLSLDVPQDPAEYKQFRNLVWLGEMASRGISLTHNGEHVPHYALSTKHIPDDDDRIEADLKKFRKLASDEMTKHIEPVREPFVDYSKVSAILRGSGVGAALYVYTARKLAQQGRALHSSSLQSEHAVAAWERLRKNLPDNVRPVKRADDKQVFALDFR